jgi:hypothetical protein
MGGPSLPAALAGACVRVHSGFTTPLCLAALTLMPVVLYGETIASTDVTAAPVESVPDVFLRSRVLASGTEVHLRLLEPVASHTHRRGDRFKLEVVELIAVDGEVIVPAGSPAIGEVIHAAKPGASGKAGELILVVRALRTGDHQVKLRSFTAGNGENRYGLATGLGVTLGIPALFVVGKNLVLPAGTDVYAKVTVDTPLPSVLGTRTADIPQPSVAESSTESNDNETDQE